jgi:hypothetical protein
VAGKEVQVEAAEAVKVDNYRSTTSLVQGVRNALPFWETIAPPKVLKWIRSGLGPDWTTPPLSLPTHTPAQVLSQVPLAQRILREYRAEAGAVRLLSKKEVQEAKFLVPWFIISKEDATKAEGFKHRLITNFRSLNKFMVAPKFKMDTWGELFPLLRKGLYAGKVDLTNAYFHLGLSEELQQYANLKVGQEYWRYSAAAFGINRIPWAWTKIMRCLQRRWRRLGLLVMVYIDDILILGVSYWETRSAIGIVLRDLKAAGLMVNIPKSTLAPVKNVQWLGMDINFEEGVVLVPQQKQKAYRRELGKLVRLSSVSCRKMAAILGKLRSLLVAFPGLRAFTDEMAVFTNQATTRGWDVCLPVPDTLKAQVLECGKLLQNWPGRKFLGRESTQLLASDSSGLAWGGLDLTIPNQVRQVHDFWREGADLLLHSHINEKELRAAIATVMSLAKPGAVVKLLVDNSVAYWYAKKEGGRKPLFNAILRPFLRWLWDNEVEVVPVQVASADMPADEISRWTFDKGDYMLNQKVSQEFMYKLQTWCVPEIDCFASPGNTLLERFISRWPHHQAEAVDSLNCSLAPYKQVWANPPWTMIYKWVVRLIQNPHLTCMLVVPLWDSAAWYPLLTRMRVGASPVLAVSPFHGLFQNCQGIWMPGPRWPLSCWIVSGKHFMNKDLVQRPLPLTWLAIT